MQIHLNALQSFFKERQHLRQLVVRMHIVDGAAALLQQTDDVLVFNLLVHLELLEGGAQGLKKGAEVIVVGEVCLGQLWRRDMPESIIQKKSCLFLHWNWH